MPARSIPFPALTHEPRIQQLSDDLERAGYHPFHAPCGVRLLEDDRPNSRCIRCQTCDGFPCLVQAKSDAEMLGVRPALEHSNVSLRTRSVVTRLETNAAGTAVERVIVERDDVEETYDADIVVISAGAANSAKILLASANDRHPNGLANGSGQVGRNYMFHNSVAVLAISNEPNPTMFQKTLGVNDFYFGMTGLRFPDGQHPDGRQVGRRDVQGRETAPDQARPDVLADRCRHPCGRFLAVDRGPAGARQPGDPDQRRQDPVDLHAEQPGTQAAALPPAQVDARHLGMHPDHLLPRTGYLKNEIPIAGCAHQAGTVRFGADPSTSVLDVNCKAHELDNLYVVDTSFFPSIGAVNPALTAMANALRVGDHLLDRLGASSGREAVGSGAGRTN